MYCYILCRYAKQARYLPNGQQVPGTVLESALPNPSFGLNKPMPQIAGTGGSAASNTNALGGGSRFGRLAQFGMGMMNNGSNPANPAVGSTSSTTTNKGVGASATDNKGLAGYGRHRY